MLKSILNRHKSTFNALAQSWFSEGAYAVSLWENGDFLEKWTFKTVHDPGAITISEAIQVGEDQIGKISVTGQLGERDRFRLLFQASLISELGRSERGLDDLAGELIDVRDRFLALYDLLRGGWTGFDLQETAIRLAQETARLVGAERAFLYLEIPEHGGVTFHYPPIHSGEDVFQAYLERLYQTSSPQVHEFTQNNGRFGTGLRDLLLIPLAVHRTEKAILGLVNKIGGQFRTPDMKLAETVGAFTAVQIDNALLYQTQLEQTKLQTEMELARRIQSRLLPQHLPKVAGLDLSAHSRSAFQIGGDFYDFFPGSGDDMIFAVGDISGKGLPAALLMAMMRTTIRSKHTVSFPLSPASILEQANGDLYDDFSNLNMFATVFIGQYSPQGRQLCYANAGHSPVIHCPANGSARLLIADSTPLCVFQTNSALNRQITLQPGDIMLIGTDGLNETRNKRDEMLGYDRLLKFVEKHSDQSAHLITNALIEEIDTFSSGNPQADDETIVVLKILDS